MVRHQIRTSLATGIAVAVLVACGGGGGGESTSTGSSANTAANVPISPSTATVVPTAVLSSRLTQGLPSADITAPYGTATITLPSKNGAPEVKIENVQFYTVSYLSDAVKTAWAAGWNGNGQTVTVIDDFETTGILRNNGTITTNRIVPTGNTAPGTYSLTLQALSNSSHGNIVSNIAAGDAEGVLNPTGVINLVLTSSTALTCGATSGYLCQSGYTNWYDSTSYTSSGTVRLTSASISVRKTPGFAKKASVINDQVDLTKYQDPTTTYEYIAGHIDNASKSSSINISAGTDIPTSNLTLNQIASIISNNTILTKTSDSVVVVAAGNSGAPCLSTNLGGCNILAALVALAPQTKSSAIVVGALTGSGSTEQIATYSVRAGALADRFMVASGEAGESGVVGTSFAAPRVAGAIALVRQKYPNLTAAEAANLLLLTANKDINNDGTPDFTGVSTVYGHGKLDILKALSPIGSAAIR